MVRMGLTFLVVAFVAGWILAPTVGRGEDTLKLGQKLEGELTGKLNLVLPVGKGPGGGRTGFGGRMTAGGGFNFGRGMDYGTYVKVQLNAGQSVSIRGTVTGTQRKVSLLLVDPQNKILTMTEGGAAVKTTELKFEEVNATGKFTVAIGSDQSGPFTLRVTDPNNNDEPVAEEVDDVSTLKERIKRLEAELAECRAKLKKLEASESEAPEKQPKSKVPAKKSARVR